MTLILTPMGLLVYTIVIVVLTLFFEHNCINLKYRKRRR